MVWASPSSRLAGNRPDPSSERRHFHRLPMELARAIGRFAPEMMLQVRDLCCQTTFQHRGIDVALLACACPVVLAVIRAPPLLS